MIRPLLLLLATSACAPTPAERTRERARELLSSARASEGDVSLRCDPEDAEVSVDGVPRGLCSDFDGSPAGLRLGSGLHRIEVKKAGHAPYVTSIDPAGARAVLTIRLVPEAGAEGKGS